MTQPQKTILKAIAVLSTFFVLINIILFFGLTDIARKYIPDIMKKTGLAVEFDRVWATLPAGIVNVSGLKITNGEGHGKITSDVISVGSGSANIGLLALCRGTVNLSSFHIQDARLTVARNDAGNINTILFDEISKPLFAPKQQTATNNIDRQTTNGTIPPRETLQQTGPAGPRVEIGKARIDTIVEYIDHLSKQGKTASIALAIKIKADDLATFGDPDTQTGSFSIQGHLAGKPGAFNINIKGTTAPIPDPVRATFNMEGSITNICTADFKELADTLGFESERIDLDINIECRNGVFAQGRCVLNAKIRKLKITGKSAGNLKGLCIDSLSTTIPLKGTIDAPDIDIMGSILQNVAGNADTLTGLINSILGGHKKKK